MKITALPPPGATIADLLEEREWTHSDLSSKLNIPIEKVAHLISGQMPIDREFAVQLAQILGSTPDFWLRREEQYRECLQKGSLG